MTYTVSFWRPRWPLAPLKALGAKSGAALAGLLLGIPGIRDNC